MNEKPVSMSELVGLGPNTYMGRPLSQDWRDLELWEKVLCLHPVRCVVELGTGNGGMSLFLAAQAAARGAVFHTFDNQLFHEFAQGLGPRLPITFHHVDLWSSQGRGQVAALLATAALHPLLLFCDDGDKPREWREFGPQLWPGDLVAVHDWPYEFGPQDVPALPLRLEPLLADWCDRRQSITRWFKVLGGTA